MPPSLTTEAKKLKPIAFTTTEAVSHLRNGGSMLLPATANFAPQHRPDCTIPLYAGSDVSSLLSLIEDMAKALEPFADVAQYILAEAPADATMWQAFVSSDGNTAQISLEYLRDVQSALSRYTEFMEQNNA